MHRRFFLTNLTDVFKEEIQSKEKKGMEKIWKERENAQWTKNEKNATDVIMTIKKSFYWYAVEKLLATKEEIQSKGME